MSAEISRNSFAVLTIGACVVAGAALSYWSWQIAKQRCAILEDQLSTCVKIADKIGALRQKKQTALLRTEPAEELNKRIDYWAREAGIPSEHIVRIQPNEPQRIGDSQYLEQITEIEVFETSLRKLVQFSQAAEINGRGLKLSTFRISSPRNIKQSQSDDELWNAELALTYLIYSPKS